MQPPISSEQNWEQAKALAAIHEVGREIAASLDLDRTLHLVMQKAAETLPIDAGVLFILDQASQQHHRVAVSHNIPPEQVDTITFAFNKGVPGWVRQWRQSLIIDDARLDARVHPTVVAAGVLSILAVPLICREKIVGEYQLTGQMQYEPFPGKILLVDNEPNIRDGLKAILQKDGHEVQDVASGADALALLPTFAAEAAVLDIRMPGMSGTELLAEIKARWPHLAVIMLTGHGTLETAITAVKEGAFDYQLKPAKANALREVVARSLVEARRQSEQMALLQTLQVGLQRLQQLPATPPFSQPSPAVLLPILRVGELVINRAAYEVRCQGLALTPAEYQVLLALAERDGAVIDYVTLVKVALDYEAEPWEAKELIKRHIYTLRQKVETQPEQPQLILNVRRGVSVGGGITAVTAPSLFGYRLVSKKRPFLLYTFRVCNELDYMHTGRGCKPKRHILPVCRIKDMSCGFV